MLSDLKLKDISVVWVRPSQALSETLKSVAGDLFIQIEDIQMTNYIQQKEI